MKKYTATIYHIGYNFDENYIIESKRFDLFGSALTYATEFYMSHIPTASAPIITDTVNKFTVEFDFNGNTYIVDINK